MDNDQTDIVPVNARELLAGVFWTVLAAVLIGTVLGNLIILAGLWPVLRQLIN